MGHSLASRRPGAEGRTPAREARWASGNILVTSGVTMSPQVSITIDGKIVGSFHYGIHDMYLFCVHCTCM